jgi:hypothetical protein
VGCVRQASCSNAGRSSSAQAYFATTSDLYKAEIHGHLGFIRGLIRKPTEEELESNFTSSGRAPAKKRPPPKSTADQMQGGEALRRALKQIEPHVLSEQAFVEGFLHVTGMDTSVTFAVYMGLENYFCRGAASHMNGIVGRFKDLKSSMDLMFGFLTDELGETVKFILQRDPMCA